MVFLHQRAYSLLNQPFLMVYRLLSFCENPIVLLLIFVCIALQGDLSAVWNDSPVLPHARSLLSREKRDLLFPQESCTCGQSCYANSVMGDYIVSIEKDCAAGALNSQFCGVMITFWQMQAKWSHISKAPKVDSDL